MKETDLIAHFPRVWHMAEDGSWDSIRKHGLLSATALLDLYRVDGERRLSLEARQRPESVTISRNGLPNAVIRDQKPMTESALGKCLTGGMTPEEWFKLLNKRVFFWLSRDRLRRLLNARAYRGRPQTVLTVDTASLVAAHRRRIELCPINSGATLYNPQPRGRSTFLPISDYPFDERRTTRTPEASVVELVVRDKVPDMINHLVAAHRIDGDDREELWRRSGTDYADGP
jgi:hypothetical protein